MVFSTSDYGYTKDRPLVEGRISSTIICTVRDNYFANQPVAFGRGLTWDVAGESVKVIDEPGQTLIGISTHTHIYEHTPIEGSWELAGYPEKSIGYPAKVALNMLDRGQLGVKVEDDIDMTVSQEVYVRVRSGLRFPFTGTFRADAGGGYAELVPNARWVGSGAAGSVVEIHIDNPQFG